MPGISGGTQQRSHDGVERLAARAGCSWPTFEASASRASDDIAELEDVMDSEKLIPADCVFVAFGSLARRESTSGSDMDWTLLVDGPADPQHVHIAQRIEQRLVELGKKKPGPTDVFGGLTFSHELIHAIGGAVDTNHNTTRRILLLLESCAVGSDDGVRERIVRHLFRRYVGEDSGYHLSKGWKVRVPRFLLNDIVRFWRTMAVDFAAKRRDRAGKGWAIRNFKLRMSRKLLFVSGLAMCLRCQLRPSAGLTGDFEDEADFNLALEDFLVELSDRRPLDVVAELCLEFDAIAAGKKIFDAYERFLAVLDDEEKRKSLEVMSIEQAHVDPLFSDTRKMSTDFQSGLTELFFHSNDELTKATQRYGVF
jgi:predicted nucleotidyltransferase